MAHAVTLRGTVTAKPKSSAKTQRPSLSLSKQQMHTLSVSITLCIDWIIKSATKDQRGMWWTLYHLLSDLHLEDAISYATPTHTHMEAMPNDLVSTASMFRLKG